MQNIPSERRKTLRKIPIFESVIFPLRSLLRGDRRITM
jgi:hypothetical protein